MQYATALLMNLTVIAIVMIGQAAKVAAQETPNLQDQTRARLVKILQTQAAAWNEGDLNAFMETYWKSPELTFSGGGETTRGWQATLDRYKMKYDSREKMGQLRFDHVEIQLLADGVALVLGQWHLIRKSDAPHGTFTLVLKNFDGEWRIVHDHSSTFEE